MKAHICYECCISCLEISKRSRCIVCEEKRADFNATENEQLRNKVESLTYIANELSSCIDEFKTLPEKSLMQAIFNMNDRFSSRIKSPESLQYLAQVKAEAHKAGYIAALITHTDEPKEWCEQQAESHAEGEAE